MDEMDDEFELCEYGSLDESEWGETMMALCNLVHYRSHISPELLTLLNKEIKENLVYVKENAKIVETHRMVTTTHKELHWHEYD